MVRMKILGSGCANCKKLEAVARAAASSLNVAADVEKVTDMTRIMTYDILATPGLVINEKVVCSGKIPTQAEVQGWIAAAQ